MAKDIRESPHSFTFGADDLSKTSDFDLDARLRGEVIKMLVILPNWTNTVYAIVTGWNKDGKEIFKSDAMAQNEEYDITLIRNEYILYGVANEQLKVALYDDEECTTPGDPGGSGGEVTVELLVER